MKKKPRKKKITRARRKNPWKNEFEDSLEKRIRKLCRNSDLSAEEISHYMGVPLSWITQACDVRRNPDSSEDAYQALIRAMESGTPGSIEDNTAIFRALVTLAATQPSAELLNQALGDVANLIEDNYTPR